MKRIGAILLIVYSCAGGPSDEQLQRDFLEANVKLKSAAYEQAIAEYDRILEFSPQFIAAMNNRGIAYLELGRVPEALDDFDQALSLAPSDYDAAFNRTKALWISGRWQAALEELQLLSASHDSAAVYFRLGQINFENNRLEQAVEAFDQSIKRDSLNVESWINRGNIYYYLNQYQNSRRDIQQALRLQPQHPLAMNTQALLLVEQEQWNEALGWVKQAHLQEPEDPYILNNLGYVYLGMDSLSQAETHINASLLTDSDNAWAYRNKAIWYLKKQQAQRALELLEQAQTLNRRLPVKDLNYYLGEALMQLDKTKEACEAWYLGQERGEDKSTQRFQEDCQG